MNIYIYYVFVNLFGLLFELVSLTFFSRCPRLSHLLCHFTVLAAVVAVVSVSYSHMGKLNCVEIQVASSTLVCLLHLWANLKSI